MFLRGKKDGELRPVQDYRALNSGTIKKRYPLPLIADLLRDLSKGKVFTTLDLRSAYNLIRIRKGDEWKTAWICKEVLQRLREKNLYCKMEKCFYGKKKLHYLGYVISPAGIEMDQTKIASVQNWPTPGKVHDIQVFLGFTNFYRRFVPNYAKITQPLTSLLKKDSMFAWSADTEASFTRLKESFRDNVVLTHADETKEFLVEVDASDFAVAGVLSQYDVQKQLRPVAFFSRQMVPAERNYEIYDKELLAVTVCLKEWRHFLQNSVHPFTILTDHKNLEFFMTSKQLTRRQARWSELLSEFTFRLSYRPGSHNDRGSSFISEGIREYEKLQHIRHHATTPYHPQTNGMVERMHATMGHAITTLTQGRPDRWDEYLQQTVFALRVRKHAVTKKSPFYLLYGVEPRLPGDDNPIPEMMAPLDEIERMEERATYCEKL
ncbi:hypothetical protein BASA81_017601 [Batrachochytrium salamandrivorans]|nr:hypothetical protein BASA81_017601 [Batrachochytrium salamandrivorans]